MGGPMSDEGLKPGWEHYPHETIPKVPEWDEAVERLASASMGTVDTKMIRSIEQLHQMARSLLRKAGLTPEHFEQLRALGWVEANNIAVVRSFEPTGPMLYRLQFGSTGDVVGGTETLTEAVARATGGPWIESQPSNE